MPTKTAITPERVGKLALKVATEAAYVVAGLADVLAGTVQDVISDRRQQLSDRKAAGAPSATTAAKQFARELPDQLKSFVDELNNAYQDLSARGRHVMQDGFAGTAHRPTRYTPQPTDITPDTTSTGTSGGEDGTYKQPPTS